MNPSALPDTFEREVSALVQQRQLERLEGERAQRLQRLTLCLEHALAPLPVALRRQVRLPSASKDQNLIRLEIGGNAYDLSIAKNDDDANGHDWRLRHAGLHLSERIWSLEGFSRIAATALHTRRWRALPWQWLTVAALMPLLGYGAWQVLLLAHQAGQPSYGGVLGILTVIALFTSLAIYDEFSQAWFPKHPVLSAPEELLREAFSAWQARAIDRLEAP